MNKSQWEEVSEGAALYRQKTSKYWWCRIKVGIDEYRFSTKEVDKLKAVKVAINQQILAESNPEHFLFNKKYKMKKLIPDAVKNLKKKKIQKPIYKQYIDRLENHIEPYFKDKTIKDITTKDLREYFELKELQSQTTINTEKRAFKIVFQYALEDNLIKQEEIPKFPEIEKNAAERREYFTEKERAVMSDKIQEWIHEAKDTKKVEGRASTKDLRQNLSYQIETILQTGIRPGDELESIKEKHLIEKGENKFLRITGGKIQTEKKYRDVPLSAVAEIFAMSASALNSKGDIDFEERYVFRVDNKKTYSAKRFEQFKKWMKKKGYLNLSEKHTMYSFRHTYITAQLMRNEVPVGLLAVSTGTSIAMIDKFYNSIKADLGHDLIIDGEMFNI